MSSAGRSRRFADGAILSLLMTVVSVPGLAQSGREVVLQNADSLEGRVIDGQNVRELIGHVRIRQDSVRIETDRALQYLSTGLVVMTGNVVVYDDSLTIRAPRGAYHRDERRVEGFDSVRVDDGRVRLTAQYGEYYVGPRRAFFRGDVYVVDTASTIRADSLTYFRGERQSVAEGNVRVYSSADRVTITGGKLFHDMATDYSRVTIHPLLVQLDVSPSGGFDTLAVRGKTLESFRDSVKRLVATDSVRIVRVDLSAVGGRAVFFTEGDSILLRISPVVWYQRTQVSGDSINVYLEKRKLRLVRVMGKPFAVSQSDTLHPERFDQMTGELMTMHFGGRGLERIEMETHAISVYHLYEDTAGNGLNRLSGDLIVMSFAAGKVDRIKVVGGVEGKYVPENMIRGREEEYAIAGFLVRRDRPSLSALLGGDAADARADAPPPAGATGPPAE